MDRLHRVGQDADMEPNRETVPGDAALESRTETLGAMSRDAYLAFERTQPMRHEYVDGWVYAMVGATRRHEDIAMNLSAASHAHAHLWLAAAPWSRPEALLSGKPSPAPASTHAAHAGAARPVATRAAVASSRRAARRAASACAAAVRPDASVAASPAEDARSSRSCCVCSAVVNL